VVFVVSVANWHHWERVRDQVARSLSAHVAERHRRGGWLVDVDQQLV
jgi:hypothetical protein